MPSTKRALLAGIVLLSACGGGSDPSGPNPPPPGGGSLTVAVTGLPASVSAAVMITGPGGYAHQVTGSETISGLAAGGYTVDAQPVTSAGHAYQPGTPNQSVSVTALGPATATVAYTEVATEGFNLRIDGLYLTQSVQTYGRAVPLVKDRDGFLRIFVTASQANLAAPAVRVRFYLAGVLASESTIPAPGPSVPRSPDEGSLNASWNLPVPKALVQPGLSIQADVDPDNQVSESNESDNVFPAVGTLTMDVRTTSTFSVRLIPVTQSVNGRTGNVTVGNKDAFLAATMRMHPLAAFDADVGPAFTTTAPALDKDNTNGAWGTILGELDARRVSDGSSRYYFGVLSPTYSSGVAGIGYVGRPTAIGWDHGGADQVAAHEWGHNWGRSHAPCGGASNPDTHYPYQGGAIGVYGFDVEAGTLKPPTSSDLMGYCSDEWISDYTYTGVLTFRSAETDRATAFAQAMQPCLLVWGRIVDGEPVLEPAFQIVTRPSLPARGGAYRVEGTDANGAQLFGLSFTPVPVADDPHGDAHFAFAVPLQPDRAARLSGLRLSVPGRAPVLLRAAARGGGQARAEVAGVRTARVARDRVALEWDAATEPMAMVRDPVSGQILAFARGGHAEVVTDRNELEIQLSTGVSSRPVRVGVGTR